MRGKEMRHTLTRYLHVILIYLFLIVFMAVISLLDDNFLSTRNLKNLLLASFPLMMVAFGQTLIILTGGIDLSLGKIVALTNVVCVTMMKPEHSMGVAAAIIVSLAVGAACGGLNGLLVTKGKLAPIIVSLATSSVFGGLALFVLPIPGGRIHMGFARILNGDLAGIPIVLLMIAAVAAGLRIVTNQTPFGKAIRAVGGNENAAYWTGVKVGRTKMLTYLLAGILCAAGGIFLTSQMYSGDPTIGGSFGTNSIAASVVGGTMMSGAVGDLLGTVAGVLLITIINNMLNLLGVSSFYQFVFQGVILIAALGLGSLKQLKK